MKPNIIAMVDLRNDKNAQTQTNPTLLSHPRFRLFLIELKILIRTPAYFRGNLNFQALRMPNEYVKALQLA
jgi:hypothetical protein